MKRSVLAILLLLTAAVATRAQVITAYNIDNMILVDGTKYPCTDVGINAALAALPSSVGTVIVPGCQGIVPISSTVTIGKNQTLILNQGTEFQPQSASVQMFSVKAGGTLRGLWADVSNQASYTGQVILLNDNFRDSTHTTVRDILCTGGSPTAGTSVCLWISGTDTNNQSAAFITVDNVHVEGFYAGVSLNTDGTGWINGNFFSNIHVSWAAFGYVFNAQGGTIEGNLFSNISYQCCATGITDSYGILMEGTAQTTQNTFSGVSIWDTNSPNVPISIGLNSAIVNNLFIGKFDGAVNDPAAQNVYLSPVPAAGAPVPSGTLQVTGKVKPGTGVKVSSLPAASTSPGAMLYVTYSTAITAEGQTCQSSSTNNQALAFSNGGVWKCF